MMVENSTPMLLALFVGSGAAVWLAGAPLARSTDTIAARFGLGQALGGLLLLAIATNLPEAAIVVAAAVRGDLSLAVGNLLGGVAAQSAVLIVIDRFGVKGGAPLATQAATPALQVEALLVMAMMAATALGAHVATASPSTPDVGDFLIPLVWVAGVAAIARLRPRSDNQRAATVAPFKSAHYAVFALASLATLAGGVGLEAAGNALAVNWGIDGVLFGGTILAAATSLPEVTTGLAAARQGEAELAASDIIGGNAFLPMLLPVASLLAGRTAFREVGPDALTLCATGVLMTAAFAASLAARPSQRLLGVGPEAGAMLASYVLGMVILARLPA